MMSNIQETRDVLMLYNQNDLPEDGLARPKNAALAARLATLLGGQIIENIGSDTAVFGFPFDAIDKESAEEFGLSKLGDLFGAIVEEPRHADKAMLHDLVDPDADCPDWYSNRLATASARAVFPGYTAFNAVQALGAYKKLTNMYGSEIRVKDSTERGGRGHHILSSPDTLSCLLRGSSKMLADGVVIEPNLRNPYVMSVGVILFKGQNYSWIGQPWDVVRNGINRFGGNDITCVRGGLDVLSRVLCRNPSFVNAIKNAKTVHKSYDLLGATISRATYDVVQGLTSNGTYLEGVVDPSLRPSASSPAEICAIEALEANPDASLVSARVRYHYDGIAREQFLEQDIFAQSPHVMITASAS